MNDIKILKIIHCDLLKGHQIIPIDELLLLYFVTLDKKF